MNESNFNVDKKFIQMVVEVLYQGSVLAEIVENHELNPIATDNFTIAHDRLMKRIEELKR